MKIRDILRSKVKKGLATVGPGMRAVEAVRVMCENRIGSIIVVDENDKPIGIFTERDVLRLVNENLAALSEKSVSEVMETDLVIGKPTDEVHYVMQTMTEKRFRHMPVMEGKNLIGIISIGDVIKGQLDTLKAQNKELQDLFYSTAHP